MRFRSTGPLSSRHGNGKTTIRILAQALVSVRFSYSSLSGILKGLYYYAGSSTEDPTRLVHMCERRGAKPRQRWRHGLDLFVHGSADTALTTE